MDIYDIFDSTDGLIEPSMSFSEMEDDIKSEDEKKEDKGEKKLISSLTRTLSSLLIDITS